MSVFNSLYFFQVNFADNDELPESFKVPPLLPTMAIRQLLAEPAGMCHI
jgi:hypothetical protein